MGQLYCCTPLGNRGINAAITKTDTDTHTHTLTGRDLKVPTVAQNLNNAFFFFFLNFATNLVL